MKRILPLLLCQLWLSGGTAFAADFITLRDGRTVSGSVESGAAGQIKIAIADSTQTLAIGEIQAIRFDRSLLLPAGTEIAVRTADAIDSDSADLSHEYAATLDDPLLVNGVEVAPVNTKAVLRVAKIVKPSGLKKIGGRAIMSLRLVAVILNGQRVDVETGEVDSQSGTKAKRTAIGAGAGAAGGAAVGAAAGGLGGAAIGAGVGAVGGALAGALTGKSVVKIAPETRFTYKLSQEAKGADSAATALPPASSTDTLILADGRSLAGSWNGIDGGVISFTVDNQAGTYPLAQAAAITFAAAARPATDDAPPPPPPPTQVTFGLTREQVVAILGQPITIADTGAKIIYVYKTVKVTFVDGRVTDFQ